MQRSAIWQVMEDIPRSGQRAGEQAEKSSPPLLGGLEVLQCYNH
jgi:hypothetical protein